MKNYLAAGLTLLTLFITGCDTAFYVGSKGMGIQSGEIVSAAGYTIVKYPYAMDHMWQAAIDVMTEMRAQRLSQEKKIAHGRIAGLVHGEKVTIEVRYDGKDSTEVAVLVGVGGNRIASLFIHDKLDAYLKKLNKQ